MKTTRRREQRGLKKVTKPHLKRAYAMLTDNEKVSKMNEDQQLSFMVGWFIAE